MDHDPRELQSLEERLSLIYALERRYGDDEAAVIAYGERAATETRRLAGMEDERARRTEEDARLLVVVANAATALSPRPRDDRCPARHARQPGIEALGFRGAAFEVGSGVGRRVAMSRRSRSTAMRSPSMPRAMDQVVYRIAPNPGEPARPLARVASGGELSRVALAIKEVVAAADRTPTLVFDEIDSGIGGRSADPVGRSLWALARDHQVLCVTHLPQIAAYADAHFQIAKRERDGRTVTAVERLDREGRIRELAQMLGGAAGGPAAMAGARELLDRADEWRRAVAGAR